MKKEKKKKNPAVVAPDPDLVFVSEREPNTVDGWCWKKRCSSLGNTGAHGDESLRITLADNRPRCRRAAALVWLQAQTKRRNAAALPNRAHCRLLPQAPDALLRHHRWREMSKHTQTCRKS